MTKERFSGYEKIIERLNLVNKIIRAKGISTDIDSSEQLTELLAINDFNKDNNTNYKLSDLKGNRYAMLEWAKRIPDVKDPLGYAISYWNNPERLPLVPAEPGALILSEYFNREKIDLHRITSRPGSAAEATKMWYSLHEPWVDLSLIHVRTGEGISKEFKVETIKRLGIHFHFDDAPEEAEVITNETQARVILIPQPWNEGYRPKSPKILTFDNMFELGLPRLEINPVSLEGQPKLILAYYLLSDYILSSLSKYK